MTRPSRALAAVLALSLGGAAAEAGPAKSVAEELALLPPAPELPLPVAASDGPPHQPFELTRSLQALQDQIALGNTAAEDAQRALLIHIAEEFLTAPPAVWQEPRNARAAVIYVFSGGQPEVMRRLIEMEQQAPLDEALLKGTLAYATGNQQVAWRLLRDLDARAMAPSLGGHVALAQGNLAMQQSPEAAARHLADARLLMPGTLVEEAALRRHIAVASMEKDDRAFERLIRQYLRRYGRSVYAASLLRNLPRLWLDLGYPNEAESIAALEELLEQLTQEQRRDVLLGIARGSLLAGRLGVTRLAAQRALKLSADDGPERLRAQLYLSSARVAAEADEESLDALQRMEPAALPAGDAELREAALTVARLVREQPSGAASAPSSPPVPEAGPSSEVIARARDALSAADDLLRRTSR